ncbi:hypothetical protein LO771_20125 [Streptacidiphilus sp. ASG 303]|uniref:hypothetical protein n=1 Tax=Streptacidiphilus sp. ASG 303 TaxID=2896847 RepID=UPI001E28AD0E|nr:hypothetical protein [Streptacidiphilus sp. ASG 303]MCD0484636.1 hypothetical protein [Streptacidiphilus sp. ASG 303]
MAESVPEPAPGSAPAEPPGGPGGPPAGPVTAAAVPPGSRPGGGPWAPSEEPLGLAVEETGHAAVDAALARLEAADGTPADAHVPLYEDVHQRLRDTLAALDNRPGPVPGP